MLSNAYFLAKFRFDTAENEPAKNLQNFRKMHFRKMRALREVLHGGVRQVPAASEVHDLELRALREVLRGRVRHAHASSFHTLQNCLMELKIYFSQPSLRLHAKKRGTKTLPCSLLACLLMGCWLSFSPSAQFLLRV